MDNIHINFTPEIFRYLVDSGVKHYGLSKINVSYNKTFGKKTFLDMEEVMPNITELMCKDLMISTNLYDTLSMFSGWKKSLTHIRVNLKAIDAGEIEGIVRVLFKFERLCYIEVNEIRNLSNYIIEQYQNKKINKRIIMIKSIK